MRRAVIAIVGMLVAVGCGGPRVPAELPTQLQTASLPQLLDRLRVRSDAIEAVKTLATLSYSGQKVHAKLVFRRPDVIQLQGFDPFGATLFDLALTAQQAQLRLPNQPPAPLAPDAPLGRSPLEASLRPADLLRLMGAVVGPFMLEREEPVLEQDGRYYLVHLLRPAPGYRWLTRRLWIDRVDLQLVRVDFFEIDGRRSATVRLGDYRPESSTPAAGGPQQWLPHTVEIEPNTPEAQPLEIKLREVRVNLPTDSDGTARVEGAQSK